MLNNNNITTAETKRKRTTRAATKPPRAPKPKPTQKTNLPPTPKDKLVNKPTTQQHPTQPSVNQRSKPENKRRDIRILENDNTNPPPPLDDLGPIDDELGVVGGPHDFASLLSFNEDDPEVDLDLDFAAGLAVPDDDLMELGICFD